MPGEFKDGGRKIGGEDLEKEKERRYLEQALSFFRKELLPNISADFDGVVVTKSRVIGGVDVGISEIIPYDSNWRENIGNAVAHPSDETGAETGDKFPFTLKDIRPVFRDELNESHGTLYLGSTPIAMEFEQYTYDDSVDDYANPSGMESFYYLKTETTTADFDDAQKQNISSIDFLKGKYGQSGYHNYESYKEEVRGLIESAKSAKDKESTVHRVPEEVEKIITQFKSSK